MRERLDILVMGAEPHTNDAVIHALRRAIQDRIAALLGASGVDATAVECTIGGGSSALDVHLELPEPVGVRLEHALAVRVLDAIRSSGRTYGKIDVSVGPTREPQDAAAVTEGRDLIVRQGAGALR